jgi:methionyl aminopeptidase
LFKGDLNETLFVGEVDEQTKLLTKVTHEALMKAIEIGKYHTN